MKVLQVVETAYRATLEEQDDTVVWITHAMKGAGADLSVLLKGNAVTYAVKGQDASGLSFGSWKQTQPPRLDRDIGSLVGKGVAVHAIAEDLVERGLANSKLVEGVALVSRGDLPKLFDAHDQVWQW